MDSDTKLRGNSFEGKKRVERIVSQLGLIMDELQSPLDVDMEEFVELFPELAEEVPDCSGSQLFGNSLNRLSAWVRDNLDSDYNEESLDDGDDEDYDDEDEIEYQNTLAIRQEFFEFDEARKADGRIITTMSKDIPVTLGDFSVVFPQSEETVAHKWRTIPKWKKRQKGLGGQIALLKAFFSEKLQRLCKELEKLSDDMEEATNQSQDYNCELNFSKIKDKRLVFCTMTGCAIYSRSC